jgi:hypothetical protein
VLLYDMVIVLGREGSEIDVDRRGGGHKPNEECLKS